MAAVAAAAAATSAVQMLVTAKRPASPGSLMTAVTIVMVVVVVVVIPMLWVWRGATVRLPAVSVVTAAKESGAGMPKVLLRMVSGSNNGEALPAMLRCR